MPPTQTFTLALRDRSEPALLRDHIQQCAFARSRFHRVFCAVEALDAFVAPRFVTTLAATIVVVLIVAMLQV